MKKNYKFIGIISIMAILLVVALITYIYGGKSEIKNSNIEDVWEETDNSTEVVANNINSKEIVVEIKGEVNKPDIYWMDENSIIDDLIKKAAGVTGEGDVTKINRAEKLKNHQSIYIPNKNEVQTSNIQSSEAKQSSGKSSDGTININFATADELDSLPGIGPAKAADIILYREQNGSFNSIDDIKNVKGIGEGSFEKLKEKITI